MSQLNTAKMYGRFAWDLPNFLRHTLTLGEAEVTVRERLKQREASLLNIMERGIFKYPRSPYLPLFKLAKCELGDVRSMVSEKGLELTLLALRSAGVYVSFEEFKGRVPIIRQGQVLEIRAEDFDNPYLKHSYAASSGGSTGAGTRVLIDLDHLTAETSHMMLAYAAHGALDMPIALWYGNLPDPTGIQNILNCALFRNLPRKWFVPITAQSPQPTFKNVFASLAIRRMGWLFGLPVPTPEPIALDQADRIARWVQETLDTDGKCLVRTHVSLAVRICVAAREQGMDLSGAIFMGGGEPPTPAKVKEITRTGAAYVPTYFFAEAGGVGWGCARPIEEDDLHLFMDHLALVQASRQIPGSDLVVDSFHYTTLLPTAPKILLNVESDDYGVVEERACGCAMESYGLTRHIRHVRSFSKLTGEGVTLVGSEMVHILQYVLPAHFGGTSLDYQLVEEEAQNGLTRLSILISPRLGEIDEGEVIEVMLNALKSSSVSADLARGIWLQAGIFRVKRIEPISTARGKLMPLHLSHTAESK